MKKILSVFLTVLILYSAEYVFAEKITVLYTGNTYGSLYPCNCPGAPYGGISRRATAIKKIRQENPNLLLLDSGNFFAGGIYDIYSVNIDLDKKRTLINAKAMQMMGYDAVAVGGDELNFGKEFLQDTIKNTEINFLVCNAGLEGARSSIIKEINNIKIGILAALPQTKKLQDTLDFTEPLVSLKDNIKKLKNANVDLVILLSQLGEKEDTRLIVEGLDIDILIVGSNAVRKDIITQVNSTIFLRPIREGRYLRRLQFEFKDGKIDYATISADEIALSEDVIDDSDITSILPRCFSDKDCRKPGLIGHCKNPGIKGSKCAFSEYAKIPLWIIEPRVCYTCNTAETLATLKKLFPGLKPKYFRSDTRQAKNIIKKFNIKMLPAYLLDKKAAKEKKFRRLIKQRAVGELKHGKYLLSPFFAGVSYFAGRDYLKNKLDMFIDLSDNRSKAALLTTRKLLEEMQGQVDFSLHFLVAEKQNGEFYTGGGKSLIEEYRRCVCIVKYHPKDWWDYIACRVNHIESSWWENCINNDNWDIEVIKRCAQSQEATKLLKENIKLTEELKVSHSPLLLLNNQEVFGITEETSILELKNIIKTKNKE